MTFQSFIVGIIGILIGFAILKYREPIRDFLGNIGFAEEYLGQGGTWTFISAMGILVPVLSVLYMFGTLQSFLIKSFGRFF